MTCSLVTCRDLRRPHHLDTHAREGVRYDAHQCVDPMASASTLCWQCEESVPGLSSDAATDPLAPAILRDHAESRPDPLGPEGGDAV